MGSNKQLKILVFIDWYLPGFKAGGPIRSIANLVARLPHDFSIVTSDRDHMADAPYPDVPTGTWVNGAGRERVMYLPAADQKPATYRRLMKELDYDVIYINSLFSPRFALMPLLAARKAKGRARVIVAPRGMLKKGALSVKAGKKKWFLRAAKVFGLFKGVRWHATSFDERKEIMRQFGKVEVKVAPNLVGYQEAPGAPLQKSAGSVKLVSVARVSPEKNVLHALQFIKGANAALGHWELTWYGVHQDPEYLTECQAMADSIPHATIHFPGEIHPQHLTKVLADAHFFYLPTLGENFGHAIVEALLAAKPVLISDRTPWTKLEDRHAGWTLPLDRILFSEMLNHLVSMDHETYASWVDGARKEGKVIAGNPKDLTRNFGLFHG